MSPGAEEKLLAVLHEIRDGQREIIAHLTAQRALAEEQLQKTRVRFDESVTLQREALRRQKLITLVALPAIVACIVAIGYLVARYF